MSRAHSRRPAHPQPNPAIGSGPPVTSTDHGELPLCSPSVRPRLPAGFRMIRATAAQSLPEFRSSRTITFQRHHVQQDHLHTQTFGRRCGCGGPQAGARAVRPTAAGVSAPLRSPGLTVPYPARPRPARAPGGALRLGGGRHPATPGPSVIHRRPLGRPKEHTDTDRTLLWQGPGHRRTARPAAAGRGRAPTPPQPREAGAPKGIWHERSSLTA